MILATFVLRLRRRLVKFLTRTARLLVDLAETLTQTDNSRGQGSSRKLPAPAAAARSSGAPATCSEHDQKATPLIRIRKVGADLKTPDEWLADYFLWGETPPSFELVRKSYPKRGSEQEAQALQALLRILRNDQPLSTTIRKRLADLFDPSSTADRCIKIEFCKKGNRPQPWEPDAQIAGFINFVEKTGGGREAAVAAAQQQFGLSRSKIYAALARHKRRRQKVPPNRE